MSDSTLQNLQSLTTDQKVFVKRGTGVPNINHTNLLTRIKPAYNPSKYIQTETYAQTSRAKLGSYSTNPIVQAKARDKLVTYNLRGERGGMGPIGPFYYKWG